MEKIKTLLAARDALYRRAADYILDTSYLTAEESVDKIIEMLGGEK